MKSTLTHARVVWLQVDRQGAKLMRQQGHTAKKRQWTNSQKQQEEQRYRTCKKWGYEQVPQSRISGTVFPIGVK